MTRQKSDWPGLPPAPESRSIPRVLIPFSDDSTLFFALRMRDVIANSGRDIAVDLAWFSDFNALSYRQMSTLLPEGPALALSSKQLEPIARSGRYDAILTSRPYLPLGELMRKKLFRMATNRACVIAFLGGLDFKPENGFARRKNFDGVYLFPRSNIESYEKMALAWDDGWQDVGFGHPAFIRPKARTEKLGTSIYFYTQAISPSTKRARRHMLNVMAAIARRNPERQVKIKLRHLPTENTAHLHREEFDYPSLFSTMTDRPANLSLVSGTMDESLADAALGITCTSTAAIDLVREGVPAMVHLDYVDNYADPLVGPMRELFADSGLITSLDNLLNLRASEPNPEWVDDMFCPPDLVDRVMNTIERFKERPFRLPA